MNDIATLQNIRNDRRSTGPAISAAPTASTESDEDGADENRIHVNAIFFIDASFLCDKPRQAIDADG